MPCPPAIKHLMTQHIQWKKFSGQDSHADESYDAPISLTCWLEEKGVSGGVVGMRKPLESEFVPRLEAYFDPADAHISDFTLRDHFIIPGIAGGEERQAQAINTFYGPPPQGDQWVVAVSL